MKRFTHFMTAGLMLCLFVFASSCKTEAPAEETAKTIPSASYKAILVKHSMAAYPVFKDVYMAHDSMRQAYGISSMFIGRGTEDTNTVIVMNRISDLPKAKEFAASPDLKMAMEKAGVTGLPTITFLDVVRDDTSSITQNDRLMVVHRVKEYDAWLKFYDGEGTAKRAENGLVDRGLARDVDDANKVYIVFAVMDKEKAMARMQSPELTKLMADAGVEGEPTFFFYTLQK